MAAGGPDPRRGVARAARRWAIAALLLAGAAEAAPAIDAPLPPLRIDDKGEALIVQDRVVFAPWTSDSLKGQWTLVQHLAARLGVDKINRPAIDAVAAAAKAGAYRRYRLVNIINVNDVVFGATAWAVDAIEGNKLRYPDAPMVADRGLGAARWGLRPRTSAIFLLDDNTIVRFVREGPLDAADVQRILQLLELPADAAARDR